ncbi:MAG TPA: serine/threonine-protein kinase [Phycisphaerae bacterium]
MREACAGNQNLLAQLANLLRAYEQAGSFLEAPAAGLAEAIASADFDEARLVRAAAEEVAALATQSEGSGPHDGPGSVIGPYKLLERIGEGGFGTVYLAEQKEPVRRRVAVKVIKLGMDTRQVIARFEAERQALAMMDHPHIAKVLDAGTIPSPTQVADSPWRGEGQREGTPSPSQGEGRGEGRPYFVMELVKGVPITQYCDDQRVPLRERLALFTDVCHAVQHAHQKGIIHRDLKPSNVLVSRHDDKPVVKVIDFGIVKATGGRLTEKTIHTEWRQLIGTPAYMSPEQAGMSDLDVDTRSDIYSLGVLLYELLTGTPPFDAQELLSAGFDEMRRIIREVEPPKPSTRLSSLLTAGIPPRAGRRGDKGSRDQGIKGARSEPRPEGRGDSEPRPSGSGPRPADGTHAQPLPYGRGSDRASSVLDIARMRRTDPQSLARSLRGDLDWIVMKCLEKDRTRRYETANALAVDIQRHLVHDPIAARPPSRQYRLRKMLRRYRGSVAVAAAFVILLGSGMIASTVLWQRAAREARETERQRASAEQIATFMEQTLASVAPSVARGRDTMLLREVLNSAAERIRASELRAAPDAEVRLRFTIGDTYRQIGAFSEAHGILRVRVSAIAVWRLRRASRTYAECSGRPPIGRGALRRSTRQVP